MSRSTQARLMRASPTATRRPPFFWIVVVVGIVMLVLYAFGVAGALRRRDQNVVRGWRWRDEGNAAVVSSVDAAGPAAGLLEVGDRLIAIDGTAFPGGYLQILFRPVGDPYNLLIRRTGDVREVRLATAIAHEPGRFVRHILPHVVTGFALCLVAITIGLLRPETRIAHLLFVAFVAVSADQLGNTFATSLELFPLLNRSERVVGVLSNVWPLSFVVIYHFFSEFPSGRVPGRVWIRLQNILYVAAAIVWLPSQLVGLIFALGLRWAVDRANELRLMTIADTFVLLGGACLEIIALVATAAVVVTNYRRVREPDQARRLRWVVLGCVLALAPGVISIILEVASQKSWDAGLGLRRVVNTRRTTFRLMASLLPGPMRDALWSLRGLPA